MSSKTYYLAGPMSGIPFFNFPKFHQITKELRDAGYNIISPAELDSPEIQAEAMQSKDGLINGAMPADVKDGKVGGETWGQILARDVRIVADEVDGVICMDGWEKSRGARLEVFVASLRKHELYTYEGNGNIAPMSRAEFLRGITGVEGFLEVKQNVSR